MLPDELTKSLESTLTSERGQKVKITDTCPIGGGCINEAHLVHTDSGRFFIKYNSSSAFPGMFEKESEGLNLLAETKTIDVPEVIATGETGKYAYLLLQFVESGTKKSDFWSDFGTRLAALHQHSAENFGFKHDNYIGSLTQSNLPHPDFISFFIGQRIGPQLKTARDKGEINHNDIKYFESLFKELPNIFPPEKPALVHGDLWSGNLMVSANGLPCLVDPAVYYGNREADIAMTELFGGFRPDFYDAYNHSFPMEKGWQKRMDILNLYPLLVHVNLFGGGYAGQVIRIIRQF